MGINAQPLPAGNEREFKEWQRNVERKVKDLAAQAGLPFSEARGGQTRWLTEAGNRITIFGTFGAEGIDDFIGFVQYDGLEHAQFMTRSDKPGIILPEWQINWVKKENFVTMNGAVFDWAFVVNPRTIHHEAMRVRFRVDSTGDAVGEVRLQEMSTGAVTDTLTTTPSSAQFASFDWLHGLEPNDGANDPDFQIQARRIAGTGDVNVHEPDQSDWTSTAFIGATSTGNARWL